MKKRVTVEVEGMTCASCVLTVKKAIESTDGTSDVDVNLLTNSATFSYDLDITTILDIQKSVKKAGYSLKLNLEEKNKELKNSKKLLLLSIVFLIPILILMVIDMFKIFMFPYMDILETILSIPLTLIVGFNIHKRAFISLFNGVINMDLLISIGTLASLTTGFLKIFGIPISNFSFVGGMIIFFFLLGKYLESLAKGRASKEIRSLLEVGAKKARIIVDNEEVEVKINELDIGDLMVVKPFVKIPTDGLIVKGSTTIDESMVTGESNEVVKKEGDEVIGGTMNGNGRIVVKVTKNQDETFLTNLIKLVEEVQNTKVPVQNLADKITTIFVPSVLIISLLSFLFSYFMYDTSIKILLEASRFLPWINPQLNRISLSIYSSVATLVIACPCALGLATPTAIMVSSGISAKRGIFIRNGEAIQRMKDVTTIVFDKTGTLTYGKPEVVDVIDFTKDEDGFKILASLERYSSHILGKSIVEKYKKDGLDFYDVSEFEEIPGVGVKGKIDGKNYFLGNPKEISKIIKNLDESLMKKIDGFQKEGKSVVLLTDYEKIISMITIRDKLREDAKKLIDELKSMNIKPVLATGDNYSYAKWVKDELGIKEFYAEVLPEDKMKIIKNLQDVGEVVAMVGDGINDAPSLKQADIGIAMGSGTDAAIETGDIILLKGNLSNVIKAIKISELTFKKIKENLFWAFFYNIIAIPLAFFGLLHPIISEMAMAFSSINVITNSLRLNKIKL
ncbi:MAG TPA: cation-translocating P-type ATPase [Caldisericia bacterium]|nr:cation-translocating P-type ATPase [Caldisericia bacterium]HQO99577.1 cation-translocating P-type ATPase [Caldisericia bacterium]